MDTEHASPQFKVGDRVKIKARHLKWHGSTGTVVHNDPGARLHPYVIEFEPFEFAAFDERELAPAPPLGVEYWRLLFRAHRDGWELLHCLRSDNFKYRSWCNDTTGDRFTLDTKRPVR